MSAQAEESKGSNPAAPPPRRQGYPPQLPVKREATVVASFVHWRRAQVLILSLNSSRRAATSTDILSMAANSTERLHHSSASDKPKPSQPGVDDVRTGWRHPITPAFVTGQGPPAGGPSSSGLCLVGPRGWRPANAGAPSGGIR